MKAAGEVILHAAALGKLAPQPAQNPSKYTGKSYEIPVFLELSDQGRNCHEAPTGRTPPQKVGSAASKRGGASSVRNRRHRVAWTGVENEIPITVRFSEKTSMGKKIRFKVAPADVLMLVRW